MRILIINYEFPPVGAGAGTAAAHMAKRMVEAGNEVRVLTSRHGGLPRTEPRDGYIIHRAPSIRRRIHMSTPPEMASFMLGGTYAGLHLARAWQPHACLAFFGIPCGPVALALKKAFGIPYVLSLRGGDVPGFMEGKLRLEHAVTAPLSRAVWRNARAVTANCRHLSLLAGNWNPEIPVSVIPNGVDPDQFSPFAKRSNTPPRILFVGRLHAQKGLDVLLRACAQLGTDFRLEIVGDGPERTSLEKLSNTLGISENTLFHGWVHRRHLPTIYRNSDIFVLPSIDEGMPNALLEASASGLACVGTNAGGNAEVIIDGETGLLLPKNDVATLARTLGTLLEGPALRKTLGDNARQRALEHFSWHSVTDQYIQLLKPDFQGDSA